ncbi:hypothetical protein MIR68_012358 [Amoeboaphelidium protococcarum]|nr:hypothetical protein MIR68_012358 [Amoeboaphelidium protococcarum]
MKSVTQLLFCVIILAKLCVSPPTLYDDGDDLSFSKEEEYLKLIIDNGSAFQPFDDNREATDDNGIPYTYARRATLGEMHRRCDPEVQQQDVVVDGYVFEDLLNAKRYIRAKIAYLADINNSEKFQMVVEERDYVDEYLDSCLPDGALQVGVVNAATGDKVKLPGVEFSRRWVSWKASITVDKQKYTIGYFDHLIYAAYAYDQVKKKQGGNPRTSGLKFANVVKKSIVRTAIQQSQRNIDNLWGFLVPTAEIADLSELQNDQDDQELSEEIDALEAELQAEGSSFEPFQAEVRQGNQLPQEQEFNLRSFEDAPGLEERVQEPKRTWFSFMNPFKRTRTG